MATRPSYPCANPKCQRLIWKGRLCGACEAATSVTAAERQEAA
jgi:hypothetical protein